MKKITNLIWRLLASIEQMVGLAIIPTNNPKLARIAGRQIMQDPTLARKLLRLDTGRFVVVELNELLSLRAHKRATIEKHEYWVMVALTGKKKGSCTPVAIEHITLEPAMQRQVDPNGEKKFTQSAAFNPDGDWGKYFENVPGVIRENMGESIDAAEYSAVLLPVDLALALGFIFEDDRPTTDEILDLDGATEEVDL